MTTNVESETESAATLRGRIEAIAIGASAGAMDALNVILPALPQHFALPVLVVVHIPFDRPSLFPSLFAAKCGVRVKEAEDKEPISNGTVYFAPPDYHLLVETDGCIALSTDAPVSFSRPSIDTLFESAADKYANGLVGIVLSGANNDGAAGLSAIVDAGGIGLVQAPETAQASSMPAAALERCSAARALSPSAIASFLLAIDPTAAS